MIYVTTEMPTSGDLKSVDSADHVCVPFRGTNMAAGNQQKHMFLSFPTYA